MKKVNIYITRGQMATLEYPENVTEQDIRIILTEITKLIPEPCKYCGGRNGNHDMECNREFDRYYDNK